jgi:hypothetical protein
MATELCPAMRASVQTSQPDAPNERIHSELQWSGVVSNEEYRIRTLVPRQSLTGADRTCAERYEVGDVLRYSRASKETGIGKGEYAQV